MVECAGPGTPDSEFHLNVLLRISPCCSASYFDSQREDRLPFSLKWNRSPPGMLWIPSGAGRGRAVGSCYRCSPPPPAFFVSSVPEVLFFPRYLMAGLGSSSEDEGDSHSESGEEETPKLPRKVRRPDPAGRGCWESPGSAVRPQPPCFCPLLVVHSLTLPLTSPSPPSSAAPGQSQDPGSRTQLTPKTTNSKRHQSTLTRTPGQ